MHFPPPQGFYDTSVQMCIYPAEKFIYSHIIVNFCLNHGDIRKRCLDKILVASWSFLITTMHCPPRQGFYDKLVQRSIFPAQKFIYGHIIVNFPLNHGDMKKICFDKIVGIILEFPNQNHALLSSAGILRKIDANVHCSGKIYIYVQIIVNFYLHHGYTK